MPVADPMTTLAFPVATRVSCWSSVHVSSSTRTCPSRSWKAGHPSSRGDRLAACVGRTELARKRDDPPGLADPGLEDVVQVGPLEVTHADRRFEACLTARRFVHVNRNELVVDCSISIPVGKVGAVLHGGNLHADRDVTQWGNQGLRNGVASSLVAYK